MTIERVKVPSTSSTTYIGHVAYCPQCRSSLGPLSGGFTENVEMACDCGNTLRALAVGKVFSYTGNPGKVVFQ